MKDVRATRTADSLTLEGPHSQRVTLRLKSSRQVERNDGDPDCRDRVALELSLETTDPDDPDSSAVLTMVYVYTRDSYDGENRDVLEDSVVNEKLVKALLAELGASGEAMGLVENLIKWLPEFRPSLQALLNHWEDRYVPNDYPRDQI